MALFKVTWCSGTRYTPKLKTAMKLARSKSAPSQGSGRCHGSKVDVVTNEGSTSHREATVGVAVCRRKVCKRTGWR